MACQAAVGEVQFWRRAGSGRARSRTFSAVLGLLFMVSAALTIGWCGSMSSMGMPMPGGWTMSMAWMRMPGQTWLGAAASFLAMWSLMMVAMMLPSLSPMLWRYRQHASSKTGEAHADGLTALVSLGYFFVWTVMGLAVYPAGVALAHVEMQLLIAARAVPMATGIVVVLAGAVQLTAWKERHLTCWREGGREHTPAPDAGTAWRYGVRLGIDCAKCCANLMAILLVVGVMDLRAMALVTAAISAERMAPDGARMARAIGTIIIGAGLFVIARAAGLA